MDQQHTLGLDGAPTLEPARVHYADPMHIKVIEQLVRYGHVAYRGVCGPAVRVEHIRARFYHEYFGGRDAWVADGQFGCITHTD